MKFNDTTNYSGLVQDARSLAGLSVTDTSYALTDITRDVNAWNRKVNSWIWQAIAEWEYDDSNQEQLPIATATMVAGQRDYTLPPTLQKLLRVEVQDDDGDWHIVKQFDQSETQTPLDELYNDTGLPEIYDLIGESILLYPSPSSDDCTLTSGLKIYYSRNIIGFNSTATNTEPGFVEDFHRILSLGAAQDFCLRTRDYNQVNILKSQIKEMRDDLTEFYSKRNLNAKPLKLNPSSEGVWGY